MKKTILLLTIAMSFTFFAHAQKNYTSGILMMLEYAKTDFKDIMGTKGTEEAELESANYTSKEIIGIGNETIVKSNKNDAAFYMCSVGLVDADRLIKDAVDLVNLYVKDGKFTGEDLEDGKGKTVTDVKNKEGFAVLRLVSQYTNDNNTDNDYFAIVIYGKTMAATMKK